MSFTPQKFSQIVDQVVPEPTDILVGYRPGEDNIKVACSQINGAWQAFEITTEDGTSFTIEHDLGKIPVNTLLVDDSGNLLPLPGINFTDENNIAVSLSAPMTGTMYIC